MQLRFGEVSPHHSVLTSGPCTVDLICQGGCYAVVAMVAREDFAASLLCCTLGELFESCAILLMLKLAHTRDCSGGTNSYMLCPAERCYSTRKLSDEMPFPCSKCA
jgi:hypothetical protein